MFVMKASVLVLFCTLVSRALAIPKPPVRNLGSGAGEIPREHGPHWGAPSFVDFNDPESELFDEYDSEPHRGPKVPSEYDFEEKESDEPEEHPDETSDELPPDSDNELPHESEGDEPVDDGFMEKDAEDDVAHVIPIDGNPEEKTEEPHEGGEEEPNPETKFPFNTAVFSIKQVNHYFKELEKAMEHVFHQTLEEASLLNKTYANTTEEDVEIDGHKFHVQKSVIEMDDADKNETLLIEAISSVNEDEPKKKRTERSNPDAERYQ